MSRPLVEVVTRHWPTSRRVGLLARQQASLATLHDSDWTQTLLVDPHGRGIAASHVRLRDFTPHGAYVWVLDDDDVCAEPHLLTRLRSVTPAADLVIMKMRHHEWGVLPSDSDWQRTPHLGKVGPACVFVQGTLWLKVRWAWSAEYAGDYSFIRAAYEMADDVAWVDCVAAEIPEVSRGAA